MTRAFSDLVLELCESYDNLEKAKAVLESEVVKLRGSHSDPTGCRLIVPSEPAVGSIVAPRLRSPAVAFVDRPKIEKSTPQPQADEKQEMREHERYLCKLAQLCDRMEISLAVKENRGGHNTDITQNVALPSSPLPTIHSAVVEMHIPHASRKRPLLNLDARDGNELGRERKEELERIAIEFEDVQDQRNFSVDWHGKGQGFKQRQRTGPISSKKNSMIDSLALQRAFEALTGVAILTYIVFLGAEVELLTRRTYDFETIFFALHMIYNVWFFIELVIRFLLAGFREFFRGSDSKLNILDLILVISSTLDVFMGRRSSTSARMLRSTRVVRLGRTIRTFRIIRVIMDVREFQKMIYAIASSFKTLMYSLVILFFIFYFFGVLFAYGAMEAREYYVEEWGGSDLEEELAIYWGTFFTGVYSCYLSVSSGQSWFYVVRPLSGYSVYLTICFVVFIAMTLFGALNVITAIFVDSSLMSTQHFKDLVILDKQHDKNVIAEHIKEVFRQIDKDGSGEISSSELAFFLSHPLLREHMQVLDIDADDTRMLFRLLDQDGSGCVDIDEFCDGCLRLKGEARALDMQVLLLQMRTFVDKWSDFTHFVREQLGVMDDKTTKLSTTLLANAIDADTISSKLGHAFASSSSHIESGCDADHPKPCDGDAMVIALDTKRTNVSFDSASAPDL